MESTPGADLAALLLAAHGLTRREQEVCQEVLAGRSTAEIATALFISANTVQNHLKSLFDKVGVRTRRELVARLARSHLDSCTERDRAPASSRSANNGSKDSDERASVPEHAGRGG